MKERDVEDILVANTASLGYRDAPIVRNVVLFPNEGRADVVLFPEDGQHRIVIIEVKKAGASDAIDKVVGQLLKYYANALRFGVNTVDKIRSYARDNPDECESHAKTTPHRIFELTSTELEPSLTDGRPLLPREIALYIAMNGDPSVPLKRIMTTLDVHHNLPIGFIRVDPNGLRVLVGADASDRLR